MKFDCCQIFYSWKNSIANISQSCQWLIFLMSSDYVQDVDYRLVCLNLEVAALYLKKNKRQTAKILDC